MAISPRMHVCGWVSALTGGAWSSLPPQSAPPQRIQGAIRGTTSEDKGQPTEGWPFCFRQGPGVWPFDFPCPVRRLGLPLLRGGPGPARPSAANVSSRPAFDRRSRRLSPHRARGSMHAAFIQTGTASPPRQRMKQGRHRQHRHAHAPDAAILKRAASEPHAIRSAQRKKPGARPGTGPPFRRGAPDDGPGAMTAGLSVVAHVSLPGRSSSAAGRGRSG